MDDTPDQRQPPLRSKTLYTTKQQTKEAVAVMYPYLTFGDGTEVVHSETFMEDGVKKVLVHFERPSADHCFDSARCELPSYSWTTWEGAFSEEDIARFEQFMRNSAHLLYRYGESGGMKVA